MKAKIFFTFLFTWLIIYCTAQTTDSLNSSAEQQLENITENNEDQETEDDSFLQEMIQFKKNPINLNTADEATLKEFRLLSAIQVANFISYRDVLGELLSVYELQAVPGWDIQTILKLRPFITVTTQFSLLETFSERFRGGEHTLILRVSQIAESSKGYLIDSSQATNYYLGSPQRLMMRYRYTFKNLLQYGIVGEKDGGEQFFKGKQSKGFDFYSAHLFIRNMGIVKSLAVGDYTVNLGQGLTQWQSLAFKKGPDIRSIKRQAAVLKPYSSSGEIYFHRGLGITVAKKNCEASGFASIRNIDANYVIDTIHGNEEFVSSLQTSGYHRTKSEVEDKSIQRQLAFGGNIAWNYKRFHVGLNAIQYSFKYPIIKDDQPYNRLALRGKSFGNYSMDYSITHNNLHFFGEAATNNNGHLAFVNGLLMSTSNNIDMSFLYRNIAPAYNALNGNAFTENTFPTNEKGLYSGISIKPSVQWQVDAYVDMYKFPALKFRVNSPSYGSDYLIQLQYKPSKQFEIYSRFKRESKGINFDPQEDVISPVVYQPRKNWRSHFVFKVSPSITLRNRVEMVWFDKKGYVPEEGFLIYGDILFKPPLSRLAGNVRLQYFETDGYNSRLYAYENDVLYSYSIPVFYEKGYRYYLNINYDITRKLTAWVKVSQTVYPDLQKIGSGLNEIQGNTKTDLKIQAMYKF
ncbi:MAG: helix-hairpin-helix domain-containing protein [Ferruginibacter sp.]